MNKLPLIMTTGLFLAGCSSIQENNEVKPCDTPTALLVEATPDKKDSGYSPETDPALLTAIMLEQARQVQDSDNEGWDITLRNQVVGIGEIACLGSDGKVYLTFEASQLMQG